MKLVWLLPKVCHSDLWSKLHVNSFLSLFKFFHSLYSVCLSLIHTASVKEMSSMATPKMYDFPIVPSIIMWWNEKQLKKRLLSVKKKKNRNRFPTATRQMGYWSPTEITFEIGFNAGSRVSGDDVFIDSDVRYCRQKSNLMKPTILNKNFRLNNIESKGFDSVFSLTSFNFWYLYLTSAPWEKKIDAGKGSVKKKWELGCSFVTLLVVFVVLFKQHA